MLAKLEKHAQLVFEHKPKELRVAVNGNFQGTLKVNSELNEIDLAVANKEPVEFIEIYSEQQLRLMLLNLDTSVPHTKANSTHSLSFSDERLLQVSVGFAADGAEIKLSYQDPTYKQIQAILENRNAIDEVVFPISENRPQVPAMPSISTRFTEYLSSLTNLFSFGWRRFALACLVVMIAVGGWMIFEQQTRLSAKAVLEESEKKRLNWQFQPDKILYWEEEEKLQGSDRLYRSKRWNNNLNGHLERLMLRYDEQNNLFWGKWVKADGTMIIFGAKTGVIVYPGVPLINEKLPSLNEEDRQVLEKYRDSKDVSGDGEEQAQYQTDWLMKNYINQTVKTHELENNGKAICVIVRSGRENSTSKVKEIEVEFDYNQETFQRELYRRKLFLDDGTIKTDEHVLITARESNLEEFENNDLAKILAAGNNVKYLTIEELVQKMKRFYKPAKQ